MKLSFKPKRGKKTSGTIFKFLMILLVQAIWLSSCRSHVMPCPSFSHLSQEEPNKIGNGPEVKFDKNGRIKK
jgi:hypothetical protein